MKIINLIKSEFLKNYTIKKVIASILLLTLASLFIVYKTDNMLIEYKSNKQNFNEHLKNFIDVFERNFKGQDITELETIQEKMSYSYSKNYIKYFSLIVNDVNSYKDWQYDFVTNNIIPLAEYNDLIELLNNASNNSEIQGICSEDNIDEKIKEFLNKACSLTIEERNELYQKNAKLIANHEKLLKENKYYLYLQYKIDNNLLDEDEYKIVKILIAKKIENSDNFLVENYIQYQKLKENANMKIDTYEEYQEKYKDADYYPSYQEYLAYNNIKNKAIESRKILLYSTEHEIKQDIFYTGLDNVSEDDMYITPKLKVNRVLHLSVIVMLIISVTNSGIISNEHSKGTIKNIITAPVKRWKILLSKFIYLVLDTYIIWLLGLIILSICAGIRFGFTELITPKLIVSGGKVIEVNYYLYLIKNILIASIPVIAFLSILFFLSAVTLNTSLTVGITSIISALALFIWELQFANIFKYIVYTPFWYLDSGYIFMNTENYQISLSAVSYSIKTGIISSIITITVLLLITNIVYLKRDIKNT